MPFFVDISFLFRKFNDFNFEKSSYKNVIYIRRKYQCYWVAVPLKKNVLKQCQLELAIVYREASHNL